MKNKIIAIGFILILFVCFALNIIKKDEEISASERRKLAKFPSITLENVVKGKTSEEFDKYTVDQFILRDSFRSIKSFWSNYVFRKKDNNGLFLKDNRIYKIEYPLNKEYVKKSAEKIKNVYEKYLNENMNIYYSIIPDKNYYLESDYLKIDVKDIQKLMEETLNQGTLQKAGLPQMEYIDITNALTLEDYYKTDLHWKQENIKKVVSTLENKMNLKDTSGINYETQELGDFYGTYYGQLGMNVQPDKINILHNSVIENATCYNYETNKTENIYDMKKWQTSSDKYDIYLSGAVPLITIENKLENTPNQKGKELLLFRDSFGSSIAPLLLENYQKITLIDLRYVSSTILGNYIDFENQDVLFLYSTLVLNQNVLR